jgi:o-succinylbenzoate synthase
VKLELRPVRLALRRPFAGVAARDGFLVFAGGGVGEALPLPSAGTETLEACRSALERCRVDPLPESIADVAASLEQLLEPCARFGVETALLDGLARRREVPLSRLFEPEPAPEARVNAVLDRATPVPLGFSAYKLKIREVGDIAWVQRVRGALGDDVELRLDANGAWTLATAVEALAKLESARPSYCEDPLSGPEQVPALRARTHVAIAADAWLADANTRGRVIEERLADVLILKPAVLGGLIATWKLAREVLPKGFGVVVTSALEGVVARLAALHLCAALRLERPVGLGTAGLLAADHAADPSPVLHGSMRVPPGVGLGLKARP